MKIQTACAAAAAAVAMSVAGSAVAAGCQFGKIAEVPVVMRGLQPTVAAQLNGHDTNFLLDTGAFFGGVSSEAAQRFAMKRSIAPFGMQLRGVTGASREAQAVRADSLSIAGMGFKNMDFLVAGRVGGDDVAGMIGENVMGAFDTEYDLANGVVRFLKAVGCPQDANLAYWSSSMALSRLTIDAVGQYTLRVVIPAHVNGRLVHAQLDSGSPVSYLSQHAAERAGIQISTQGVEAGGITYGVYGRGIETYLAPFASFKVGDEEIKNTRLRVANIELGDGADMLLGADFFLSHRILISNSQKKLYFTYNGGPVFRLDSRPAGTQTAQGGATAGAAGAADAPKSEGGPKTGSEFARRAAASAARHDYAAAIADYGKAIALEPENAAYYRSRADARLADHQAVLAMADLDEALKRQPNDIRGLVLRAELYLRSNDVKRAQADFEAALKLAPPDGDLPAEVGLAYATGGQYELALKQLDTWIAAHRRNENLGRALAARCWTRALSGKQLDLALADCDQALKHDRNSELMSYRALSLYRMGRIDEALAQYAQALKEQPRMALALYGRGLAELKKGDKAKGEADMAAANAISPELTQQYRRAGLAPDTAPQAPPAAKAGG